jgi:hypothetical protein
MWMPAVLTCLLALGLTGCAGADEVPSGTLTPRTAPSDTRSDAPPDPPFRRGPPPVTVRYGDSAVDLEAHTYCYGNRCVDGIPADDPADVGSPEEVIVEFPLAGWSFQAFFSPVGRQRCPRSQTARLERTGEGSFVLRPAGRAGSYDVTLFGRGDGDLATAFRWSTPFDGPLAKPRSRLAVLAGHDGQVDSYGIELSLSNLAATPDVARAAITVTSADGKALSFEAHRARGCQPEGSVYWDGPDERGLAAAELGHPPFTYDVEVVLDGERHVATAQWPADVIRGNEPSVALEFEPPLPGLR